MRGKKGADRTSRGALLARIEALEERVARLEAERKGADPPPKPPPQTKPVKRCPGCFLPMPERPREQCEYCGFVFAVIAKR